MIQITEFPNGFRVGTDAMHDVETVTVSLAIGVGSRFEKEEESGISHFLEHMAFKGTKTRTALDIAKAIEMVGGHMNAFTSKERTVYYVKVLKWDLRLAIDILSDIIQNSIFSEEEIERERGVILQELASAEDTPDDIVFDYYYKTLFTDQAIGRPIIGNRETIRSFGRDDFQNYINSKYNAGNMVLSVAGNTDHKTVCALSQEFFSCLNPKAKVEAAPAVYDGGEFIKKNPDLIQAQFVLGYKGLSVFDGKFYALKVMNNILGGGMSSRLFQEVREKRGLVYTISSFENTFLDSGIFGVYAGTSPESIPELKETIKGELDKITNYIVDEEIEKTITQLKAGLLMALESTTSRSQKLGMNLLTYNRHLSNEEIIANFEGVKKSDVMDVAKDILNSNETLVVYGNV